MNTLSLRFFGFLVASIAFAFAFAFAFTDASAHPYIEQIDQYQELDSEKKKEDPLRQFKVDGQVFFGSLDEPLANTRISIRITKPGWKTRRSGIKTDSSGKFIFLRNEIPKGTVIQFRFSKSPELNVLITDEILKTDLKVLLKPFDKSKKGVLMAGQKKQPLPLTEITFLNKKTKSKFKRKTNNKGEFFYEGLPEEDLEARISHFNYYWGRGRGGHLRTHSSSLYNLKQSVDLHMMKVSHLVQLDFTIPENFNPEMIGFYIFEKSGEPSYLQIKKKSVLISFQQLVNLDLYLTAANHKNFEFMGYRGTLSAEQIHAGKVSIKFNSFVERRIRLLDENSQVVKSAAGFNPLDKRICYPEFSEFLFAGIKPADPRKEGFRLLPTKVEGEFILRSFKKPDPILIFSPYGNLLLPSDEILKLKDGDILKLENKQTIRGKIKFKHKRTFFGSYVQITLDNGKRMNAWYGKDGVFSLYVAKDVAEAKIEVPIGGRRNRYSINSVKVGEFKEWVVDS